MIRFRGNSANARTIAYELKAALAGNSSKVSQTAVEGFFLAIGYAALLDIYHAFITKADGGTDEMGIQWPPLQPETIANRRFGPGEKAQANRQAKEKIQRNKDNLKREEDRIFTRLAVSMPAKDARARAKEYARGAALNTGTKFRFRDLTRVEKYGHRKVEILRDTGVLLNSLTPGQRAGSKPAGKGGGEQIFELNAGSVIVGTNVEYAATHNFGSQARNIPRRQFLPDNEDQVPEAWWDRWLAASVDALKASVEYVYRSAA